MITVTSSLWITNYGKATIDNYDTPEMAQHLNVSSTDMSSSGWIKVGEITGFASFLPRSELVKESPEKIKGEIALLKARLAETEMKLSIVETQS